ncbi:TPA: hypothetical protein ACH3X2_004210 [Trebouxia sp. C0005]
MKPLFDMLLRSRLNGCNNLTDYIAFIYDYLISELQLEPCGNINSLYLAAKNTNISGGTCANELVSWTVAAINDSSQYWVLSSAVYTCCSFFLRNCVRMQWLSLIVLVCQLNSQRDSLKTRSVTCDSTDSLVCRFYHPSEATVKIQRKASQFE